MTTEVRTPPDAALTREALRKVQWRLLPFLGLLFYINFLDRTNVSFAAITMNKDLGLSQAAFGLGAGLFFVGYFFFEIPSNLIMHRVGARLWLSRIMISWGVVAVLSALAWNAGSFYVLRFLLGIAEAGFFPGVIVYLTYWFPRAERAKALAWFYLSIPFAVSTGGLLSGYLLSHSVLLKSWQFLYVTEGFPAVIIGLFCLFYLTDRPLKAAWLTAPEREGLAAVLEAEERSTPARDSLRASMLSGRILALAVVYAGLNFGIYTVTFFLPQVIKAMSTQLSSVTIGLINAIPFAVTAVFMVLWNAHSDRSGKPVQHVTIPLVAGAIVVVAASKIGGPVWLLVGITFALFGVIGSLPSFWKCTTSTLGGIGAAGAVALVNSVGNLGGFAGPYVTGILRERTGSYDLGWVVLACVMLAALIIGMVAVRATRPTPLGLTLSRPADT
jgi:ACS family tartrate transporter-like MFS transporter